LSRYRYHNSKVLFKGKRVDLVSIESEHPRGGVHHLELVDHPGAAVILPLFDAETVVLIRNERSIVQQTLWELPAGTLEEGEEPLACAERELVEETGYHAHTITPLFDFFSTPGFCNEILFAFLAQELHFVGQNLDESEQISVEKVPLSHALEMIRKGIICDAKTICALLYFKTYCHGK
jgi:ADP-ribose pyrophosphatase